MAIEGDSEVARLCAAGMSVDGDHAAALALFMQAWDLRRDDYEASIAAHFVEAMVAVTRGLSCLELLPEDGYRKFVEGGLRRLDERLSYQPIP
jgi:hypothetical protein